MASARFPAVPPAAGHYESFYLKACDPSAAARPCGFATPCTSARGRRRPARSGSRCSARGQGGPRTALKQTFDEVSAPAPSWIRVGDATFGRGAPWWAGPRRQGARREWDLTLETPEPPLRHLPREWMYRAPVPRTKLESPCPDARFSGRVAIDGVEAQLDGWRGMVGHNWGAQHAERWIWLHGAGFAEREDAWLDVALGRIKLGPVTTPWVANGALSVGGERIRLGGSSAPGAPTCTSRRIMPISPCPART